MAEIEITRKELKVNPGPGRRIISKFIDYATGLLIVAEIYIDDNMPSSIFQTTIDVELKKIIEPKNRNINYDERIEPSDDQHKSMVTRVVNYETGFEYFEGKVYDVEGKEVFCRQYDAFQAAPPQSNFDYFLNFMNEKRKEKEEADREYKLLSHDEKVRHWSGTLHRQMRWQAESGLDPYAIYDPEWYENAKKTEPNLDQIMDEVFEKYWSTTGGKRSKEEYLKRIGK